MTCSIRGHGKIPCAPFIITTPPVLMTQWHNELCKFLKKGAFAIVPYQQSTAEGRDLVLKRHWNNDDTFGAVDIGRRIILAAVTVCWAAFTKLILDAHDCDLL